MRHLRWAYTSSSKPRVRAVPMDNAEEFQLWLFLSRAQKCGMVLIFFWRFFATIALFESFGFSWTLFWYPDFMEQWTFPDSKRWRKNKINSSSHPCVTLRILAAGIRIWWNLFGLILKGLEVLSSADSAPRETHQPVGDGALQSQGKFFPS